MARLLPDPPSRTGGILSQRELDAALRVLSTLRQRQPATVVLSWDSDMQDVLRGLTRMRYVETRPAYGGHSPKATAPFKPDVLETTLLGLEYLESIQAAQSARPARHHATRKRSSTQLNREIAANLTERGQPQLAALFADPFSRKTFARELRHEMQKQQTSQEHAAHRAARPFTVKRLEQVGDRRVRSIVGNYATEAEARSRADQLDGWVVTRDGRVVYGRAQEP